MSRVVCIQAWLCPKTRAISKSPVALSTPLSYEVAFFQAESPSTVVKGLLSACVLKLSFSQQKKKTVMTVALKVQGSVLLNDLILCLSPNHPFPQGMKSDDGAWVVFPHSWWEIKCAWRWWREEGGWVTRAPWTQRGKSRYCGQKERQPHSQNKTCPTCVFENYMTK